MSKNKKAAKKTKVSNKKERIFGSPIRNLLFAALVSALLGVALLLEPTAVYENCGYAIGGLIGVIGILYIIIYFCRKPVSGMYRYEFFIGLVALLIGAYVAFGNFREAGVSATGIGFEIIVKILGLLIMADGVLKLQYTIDCARMKYPRWWVGLIFSILGIALGVVTILGYTYDVGDKLNLASLPFVNGSGAFISGMAALGLASCVNALLDLFTTFVIGARNRMARRELAVAEASALMAAAKQEEIDEAIPEPAPVPEVYVPAPEAPQEEVFEPAPADEP